jgi:hypothetical protein
MMALTDLTIRKVTSKKEVELLDGNGLHLRVQASGGKSFIYRYRFNAKHRRMTLGQYPGMSLVEAREKHVLAAQELRKGNDPGRQAMEANTEAASTPTFKELLEEFWTIELSKKPSGKERRRLVQKDALPAWSNRKVTSITRRDAVLLIDGIRESAYWSKSSPRCPGENDELCCGTWHY